MSAVKEAYAWQPLYAVFMVAVFVGYIPGNTHLPFLPRTALLTDWLISGLFTLYTHMMRQRRKVLGVKGGEREKGGEKKAR